MAIEASVRHSWNSRKCLSQVHTCDISISISTRSIRKQRLVNTKQFRLVHTKQREFFFVLSFVLLLAYASTMFLCLSLCRSICRRLHCIPLFCLLFVLMLILLVWTRLYARLDLRKYKLFELIFQDVFAEVLEQVVTIWVGNAWVRRFETEVLYNLCTDMVQWCDVRHDSSHKMECTYLFVLYRSKCLAVFFCFSLLVQRFVQPL